MIILWDYSKINQFSRVFPAFSCPPAFSNKHFFKYFCVFLLFGPICFPFLPQNEVKRGEKQKKSIFQPRNELQSWSSIYNIFSVICLAENKNISQKCLLLLVKPSCLISKHSIRFKKHKKVFYVFWVTIHLFRATVF